MNVYIAEKRMYEVIGIGVSAGGLAVLSNIIPQLPADYPFPVIIVQHRGYSQDNFMVEYLNKRSKLQVKEAVSKESIKAGCVYIAPAGYHLLVERDKTFSLSVDLPVCYSIPSIDVLFESCAQAYESKFVGLILTGANNDGSEGLKRVKELNGLALVQDPATAESTAMPLAAINTLEVDHILPLNDIGEFLNRLPLEQAKGDGVESKDPDS